MRKNAILGGLILAAFVGSALAVMITLWCDIRASAHKWVIWGVWRA
jgi:hypothetical protein